MLINIFSDNQTPNIYTNIAYKSRKYRLDKFRLGYKPSDQLHTHCFIDHYVPIPDPGGKNGHEAAQRRCIFHVLDIFTAHKKQFCYGFIVIVFPAYPFEQDKACEHKRCAAYSQVIVYPVELLPKFQQRFAGFETTFDRPAVPITPYDLAGGQAAVCGKQDNVFIFFVFVTYKHKLYRNVMFFSMYHNRTKDAVGLVNPHIPYQFL